MTLTLMAHQETAAEFMAAHPRAFNNSDPGTGKTIATLEAYRRTLRGRMLVLAPLSILRPSWGNDIELALPGFKWDIAHGSPQKRRAAFLSKADIVVMNHDGVKWLVDQPDMRELLLSFSHLSVDEYTAFKNRGTQRWKALRQVAEHFEYIWQLSGTPTPNTVTELWAPTFILDKGKRLGKNFFKFRQQVCTPRQVNPSIPNAVQWVDKSDAETVVSTLLKDVTIRFTADECLDLPEHFVHDMVVDMPKSVMRAYRKLERDAMLVTEQQEVINSIHAGTLVRKLLQLLTGAVYDEFGKVVKVHPERYQLVMDLIEERQQCIVAYNWKHEVDQLTDLAKKRGFTFGVISGSVSRTERENAVRDFQRGDLRVMFCNPAAASHGLTLTAGTSTIWASPTYNAEHYLQLNRRIHRKGQTRKTETIRIAARGTKELEVYDKLGDKLVRVEQLLDLFAQLKDAA